MNKDTVKPSYCSPSHSGNDGTCLSDRSLLKLADSYNQMHKDKINIPVETKKERLSRDKRSDIWKSLIAKLKSNNELPCEDEFCILYTDVAEKINDNELHEETYRPERPENWYDNPNEWLTNIDIENVMRQYEKTHPGFAFLGPSPIDFDAKIGTTDQCVEKSICNLHLRNMYQKGKKRVGIVFNLDPHYKSGSHWTAMMCDMEAGGLYYFDSYGIKPPQEVRILMSRLRSQGNQLIADGQLSASRMRPIHIYPLDGKWIGGAEFKSNDSGVRTGGSGNKKPRKVIKGDVCHIMENGKIVDGSQMRVQQVKPGDIIVFDREIALAYRDKVANGSCRIVRRDFEELYNSTRFQYENSECGMFSMYFLLQFLENKNFYEIVRNRVNDQFVWRKRNEYFRPNINRIPQLPTGNEGENADKSLILKAIINGGRNKVKSGKKKSNGKKRSN
jgi:hypothetical protein